MRLNLQVVVYCLGNGNCTVGSIGIVVHRVVVAGNMSVNGIDPIVVIVERDKQGKVQRTEEFHLHYVDLFYGDVCDFGPSFVCVCVVVEKLVGKHQCDCECSEFGARMSLYGGDFYFHSVNV